MRKVLLGAAAMFAMATPAMADTTGFVEANAFTANYDSGFGDQDVDGFGLGGAVVTDIHNGWQVQFDGALSDFTWDSSSGSDSGGQVGLHVFKRNDTWALGGFVGLAQTYGTSIRQIGAEGQWFFSNLSLSGTANYGDVDEFTDFSLWNFDLGADYFFMPNFSVGGHVGKTTFDDYDDDAMVYGLDAEFQFADCPLSIFGGYDNFEFDYGGGSEADVDQFMLGLRFNFGGGTLHDRNRNGASMTGNQHAAIAYRYWD